MRQSPIKPAANAKFFFCTFKISNSTNLSQKPTHLG